MWFYKLMGFQEINPDQVRDNIKILDNLLISKINNREFVFGQLEIPSLSELRNQSDGLEKYQSQIKISEEVGDIQTMHKDASNRDSVIQVASQFNLLEMIGPSITPEKGVGIYENDPTQGPACAIACGAGTIYRNYFANVGGRIGQTSDNQVDCLKEISIELENDKHEYWEMKNGYVLTTENRLIAVSEKIKSLSPEDYESLKGKLRIGVQWNSEVTISENKNFITQVYCSALPVTYNRIKTELWHYFAKLVLEATYEATLFVAIKNYEKTKNNKVFLTFIGGGAFGNERDWILDAIKKAILKFSNTPLDVRIVSYRYSNPSTRQFIDSIKNDLAQKGAE